MRLTLLSEKSFNHFDTYEIYAEGVYARAEHKKDHTTLSQIDTGGK